MKPSAPTRPSASSRLGVQGKPARAGAEARSRLSVLHRSRSINELQSTMREQEVEAEEFALPSEVLLLCEELPAFLACQVEEDPELGLAGAVESASRRSGSRRAGCTLSIVLRSWLRAGLRQMSSSKE